MRWVYLAVIILFAAATTIFAAQNFEIVTMSFLGFSARVPLALLVAVAYLLGAATGGSLYALLRRKPTEKPVVQPAAGKVETEVKNPFDSDRRYDKRVTHAANYSKLTGQLYYVHADGGLWVLRYASLDVEDGKGGSVILARDRQMNNYREGDLVTVEGEVISDKGSTRLGGPLYRVRSIVLVDRPK